MTRRLTKNSLAYNVPKLLDANGVANDFGCAYGFNSQLGYMKSMYAVEKTNPGAYKFGEDVTTAVSSVATIKGVLEKFPRLFKSAANAAGKEAVSKQVTEIVNQNAEGRYQKVK